MPFPHARLALHRGTMTLFINGEAVAAVIASDAPLAVATAEELWLVNPASHPACVPVGRPSPAGAADGPLGAMVNGQLATADTFAGRQYFLAAAIEREVIRS